MLSSSAATAEQKLPPVQEKKMDIRNFFKAANPPKRSNPTSSSSDSSTRPSQRRKLVTEKSKKPLLFSLPHRSVRDWKRVQAMLGGPIVSTKHLKNIFRDLHPQKRIKLRGFAQFVDDTMSDEERTRFFDKTLPFIQKLLLQLPKAFNNEKLLPLLRAYNEGSVDLTRHQCACLLAASFFCVHQKKSSMKYQSPNFTSFYASTSLSQSGKFQCILHYFERLREEVEKSGKLEDRMITFHRRVLSRELCNQFEPQNVTNLGLGVPLTDVVVRDSGTIEDDGKGMLQADFANKYIGGGVLNTGCVQEEIRFMINPECLVSLLLCDVMKSRESIVIIGAERFSDYEGYGNTFAWSGDHRDETETDQVGRLATVIVAVDAIQCYKTPQYKKKAMVRELAKAYCGFSVTEDILSQPYDIVATGNWGCGVFGGDVELKSLLQWCAISLCQRSTQYFTFGERGTEYFAVVVKVLRENNVTVNELWRLIVENGGKNLYKRVLEKYSPEDAKQLHLSFSMLSDNSWDSDTDMSEPEMDSKSSEKSQSKDEDSSKIYIKPKNGEKNDDSSKIDIKRKSGESSEGSSKIDIEPSGEKGDGNP